jgi:hypothetical protein
MGEAEVQFHSFLTSALDRGEWSTPLLLGKEPLVVTEQLAVWALEPVWAFWRGQKSPTIARIETAD